MSSVDKKQGKEFYVMLGAMVITGALNTIFVKLQNASYPAIDICNAPFNHPWFQTFNMFVGEFYCAILWFTMKQRYLKQEEEEEQAKGEVDERPHPPIWLFLITCSFDVLGTTLLNFALISMASSVFQMLRGAIILITCLFSIIFLKKYPKNYQWLGVGLVFLGVFLVGLASQIDGGGETAIYSIVMVLISLIFSGFQFILQEKFLNNYKTPSMMLVAWEGIWGLAIFLVLLPIFQFIPCDFTGKDDVCSSNGEIPAKYTLENTIIAFQQMGAQWPLLIFTIGQTFSIAGFNYTGINLVKYSSAATRSVMDSTRTILVWIFFLFYKTWSGKANDGLGGYVTEKFLWLQLVGFFILLIGQVIYNGILKIPFFGFDVHFKKNEIADGENQNQVAGLLNTKDPSENSK